MQARSPLHSVIMRKVMGSKGGGGRKACASIDVTSISATRKPLHSRIIIGLPHPPSTRMLTQDIVDGNEIATQCQVIGNSLGSQPVSQLAVIASIICDCPLLIIYG